MRASAKAWLRILAPAAAYLLAATLVRRALSLWAFPGLPDGQRDTVASALTSILLTPAALYWRRRDRLELTGGAQVSTGRFPTGPALLGAGLGVLLGAANILASRALPGHFPAEPPLAGPAWLVLLQAFSLCVAGPICEESIYRGLVQERGEALLGTLPAAILSAALFSAGHGSVSRLLPSFVAGLVFAAVMLLSRRSGNDRWALVSPIFCHAAANAAMLAMRAAGA